MPTPRGPDSDKRSEERKLAEKMFLDSNGKAKLVDIAEKMKLPSSKIRKWKSMDGWEEKLRPSGAEKGKKKQVERSTCDKGSVPPKKGAGAPKGNKNAKGHHNPVPPPDTTKHGGYSAVYWDTLSEEERALIEDMPKSEEELLIEQIQLFSVRERRIMTAINKYRNSDSPVALSFNQRSERKRAFENDDDKEEYARRISEKVIVGERLPGNEYSTFTQTENKDQIIARLESELSNVQSKKTKAIEALAKLHLENRKLDGDNKGNEVVREWTQRILEQRRNGNGS